VITWVERLEVDRSEVEITDGVELGIGAVDDRSDPDRDGMLDIGMVLAIDTGEAVYWGILDEEVTAVDDVLELYVADELEVTKEDSVSGNRFDEELDRKLVCPVVSTGLMT